MTASGPATVVGWRSETPEEGAFVVYLETAEGGELAVELSSEEVSWLQRSQHPVYSRFITPLLEHMAGRALSIHISKGMRSITVELTFTDGDTLSTMLLPLVTALALTARHPIPLFVDPSLCNDGPPQHELDLDELRYFLEAVSPTDFAPDDAGP